MRLDQGLSQHQRQQQGQEQPAEPVHPSVSHGQQEPYQQESPEPIAEHPGDVVSEDRLGIAQNLGQYFGQAHPREFWVLGTLQSVLHKTSSPGQRCKGGNAQGQSAADVIAGHPGSSQEKERQQEAPHRSQAGLNGSPPPHTDGDRQNQESEGIRDQESEPDQSSQQGRPERISKCHDPGATVFVGVGGAPDVQGNHADSHAQQPQPHRG